MDGSDADPKIHVPPLTGCSPDGLAATDGDAPVDGDAAVLGGAAVACEGAGVALPEHAANIIAATAASATALSRSIPVLLLHVDG